jgi:hypothetical protein
MSEWWTYSLSDFLLFSPRTYRRLFELVNADLWPLHVAAAAAGVLVAWAAWRGRPHAVRWVLAMAWAAVAYGFFVRHYASIHWAAPAMAGAFALQALLLASVSASPPRGHRRAALALIVFGLVLQPLIGPLLLGRPWTQAEVFGVAPDPTVTVTLGAIAWLAGSRRALLLWPIPLAWCAVGAATLWTMRDADAWLMPALAVCALAAASRRAQAATPGAAGADGRT